MTMPRQHSTAPLSDGTAFNPHTTPLNDGKSIDPSELNGHSHSSSGVNRQALTEEEQVDIIRQLRKETALAYRPIFKQAVAPIRAMARMVREVEGKARAAGISDEILAREVSNRTIGDVNVRMITENIDGVDYSTIGEDLGIIIPGEAIGGRISEGRVHAEMNLREDKIERKLLDEYNWDIRVYDVYGVGNPYLRELLVERFKRQWGLPVSVETTFVSIGALDALFKSILALTHNFKKKYGTTPTFAFPAPGFAVVNWQVEMAGCKLLKIATNEASNFVLTYEQVKEALASDPELRMIYLTVSNNPTAFSYSPEQIKEVYRAIEEDGRELAVLADLAYIGTGDPEEDCARMAAFNTPEIMQRTLFINSFSKVFTLTGDRFGWVSTADTAWAELLRTPWNNCTAGLPAEWQLRFTAYVEWFEEHPEIQDKIRDLYAMRRDHLRAQLAEINKEQHLFETIGVDDNTTIYNWSKLMPGEDALSLFEKTGIAGVSGSAFGYDDRYIRLSVGFIPIQ